MSMLKLFLDQQQRRAPSPLCALSCVGFCVLWLSLLSFVVSSGSYLPPWHFTVVSGSWAARTPSRQRAMLQGYSLSNAASSSHPVISSLVKSPENRNSLQPSLLFLLYMRRQEREFRILL